MCQLQSQVKDINKFESYHTYIELLNQFRLQNKLVNKFKKMYYSKTTMLNVSLKKVFQFLLNDTSDDSTEAGLGFNKITHNH